MSEEPTNQVARPKRPERISADTVPKIGTWYHVDYEESTWDGEKTTKTPATMLMCVAHLASNHVLFSRNSAGGGSCLEQVRYEDLLAKTRLEPDWKAIIEEEIDGKKAELYSAVTKLADKLRASDLLSDSPNAAPTLLPSVVRVSPEEQKKKLTRLKEKEYPAAEKHIEKITQEMVALHRDLCLPMFVEADRMETAIKKVDQRLFALELYAGIFDDVLQIKEGAPAEQETPVSVRQMLRYMDEECLIDYDGGGMDYRKLSDFDDWVAKPENYLRLCPEPRCIVALKVRRHMKDYGRPESLVHAIRMLEEHKANMKTYLLMRNGEQLFRLATEIEFDPRLLPLRAEFHKPFTRRSWHGAETEDIVTPRDLDYDRHRDERLEEIFKYNRVMFLLQGILDRSKVFSPHPPINLADEDHIERYFKAIFDEELGLPSASPPVWEDYRAKVNASIKLGSHVYGGRYLKGEEPVKRYRRDTRYAGDNRGYNVNCKPACAEVTSIRRDKVTKKVIGVRVSWDWGKRWGYEHSDGSGGYYGKYGEWPVNKKCHAWLDIDTVFHVEGYKPGDFKMFLCDAYLKGEYLKWAPPLLTAEQWHKGQDTGDQDIPDEDDDE